MLDLLENSSTLALIVGLDAGEGQERLLIDDRSAELAGSAELAAARTGVQANDQLDLLADGLGDAHAGLLSELTWT